VVFKATSPETSVKNLKILVTAGPTLEYLDPVRYISNRSTGTMGYAITEECLKKGFSVCLITGPVCIEAPQGAEVVKVTTAEEMFKEVTARSSSCCCLVMAAAVSDFKPARKEQKKIKKDKVPQIKFVRNKDILGALRNRRGFVKIGFALETNNAVLNGEKKLHGKKLDLIVVNRAGKNSSPFGNSVTDYVFLGRDGKKRVFKKTGKKKIARVISNEAEKLVKEGLRER
jgi:phosphopantothenoylcysteine decarboxylase / phosphopantothenate---cysteine ligase